jgi:hypothetical protein
LAPSSVVAVDWRVDRRRLQADSALVTAAQPLDSRVIRCLHIDLEGDAAASFDAEAVGIGQDGTLARIGFQTAGSRKRIIALEAERPASMAFPALAENGPLHLRLCGIPWPIEDLDRMTLGTGAPGQLPSLTALLLNRDGAVLDRVPAEDLQKLLQFAAMRAERPGPELACEIEAGRVYLVHERRSPNACRQSLQSPARLGNVQSLHRF